VRAVRFGWAQDGSVELLADALLRADSAELRAAECDSVQVDSAAPLVDARAPRSADSSLGDSAERPAADLAPAELPGASAGDFPAASRQQLRVVAPVAQPERLQAAPAHLPEDGHSSQRRALPEARPSPRDAPLQAGAS
jgi:hypothetical protein